MIDFLMHKFVTFNRNLFIILHCMFEFECLLAKNSTGSNYDYKGKYTSDIADYEVIVPQRVNKDGNFISHVISHQHSKRSATEIDSIFYKLPIEGKEYLIELTPSKKLISPGAVVEVHKYDFRKLNNWFPSSQIENNSTVFNMLNNLNTKPLKNTNCHFSGIVKGENNSKAALSTCYGLAGFIQIPNGFYTIEPITEHDPFIEDAFPHLIYKSNSLVNSSVCQTVGKITALLTDQTARVRRESNVLSNPLYVETLIVMDKSLLSYHKESDCENYVLTVFNMAHNLFQDDSFGLMMTLTIVRIIRLEVESTKVNVKVSSDAEKIFEDFQKWQYEINPGDDSHPNHHDVAVLLTRLNVCFSPTSCGLLGLTTIGKACDPKLSAALCEDTGLRLGFIIAHEIGHLLGAEHDLKNSSCDGTDDSGLTTVMHPQVTVTAQSWSQCSQAHIRTFVKSGMGNCFLDEPEDHHFNVPDMLPGALYNADFQCKHTLTADSRECDIGSSCNSLNCYVPGYACIITHFPPADGTRCGENMWCHSHKCLNVGERPRAVDGNWGEWSGWSDCTQTCGSGIAMSMRHCNKPLPSHKGKNCVGERRRYRICASTPCETGRPSFRDVQCGEFNDWIYPEDGKMHTWKAYFVHDGDPCVLYCINEEKQVAALKPRVIDGTMCYKGMRDICISGTCKTIPCDLQLDSNAVEDACGVCHGDGTECEFSGGEETFLQSKGLSILVVIPSGTRNIKVEKIFPSLARIILKDKETKEVYIERTSIGMYDVPGSQAWLGMIRKDQESLYIPGPITKPLSIWVDKLDNVTLKWSFALPLSQQRKPEFTWDFLKWGSCSTKCGPGIQVSEPNCIEEKAGLVENIFCADLEMPVVKVRPCEVAKCEARWMVGDWKEYEDSSKQKKFRKRMVYCVKQVGEGDGESQIIRDNECPKPKPHETEPYVRQKREDSESNRIIFEDSLFRSGTSEFGFHKKYDDYLTHFAALSAPQRKSETIPFHLVSSPHFKHYFRVLETPEDYSEATDFEKNNNIDFFNSSFLGSHQNKNKVSPDFYKNTFSGNPVDISHMQSGVSFKQRKNNFLISNKFFMTEKLKKKRTAKSRDIDIKERVKNEKKLENLLLKNSRKLRKKYYSQSHLGHYKKFNSKSQKKRHPCKTTQRQTRNLFLKNPPKSFNYDSSNLIDFIENIYKDQTIQKNQFIKLIKKINTKESSNYYQSTINKQWPAYREHRKKHVDFSNFQPETSLLKKFNQNFLRKRHNGYKLQNNYGLFRKFDGSGKQRCNMFFQKSGNNTLKRFFKQKDKNENTNTERCVSLRKNSLFLNSYYPKKSENVQSDPKKESIKKKIKSLNEFWLENKDRKYKINGLKNQESDFNLLMNQLNECMGYNINSNSLQNNRISKRLSRKWKKAKKDMQGNHTKSILKQVKNENNENFEKTVINTGKLVIDKDLPDRQIVEIILQDDENEYADSKFKDLPKPILPQRKIELHGKEVFDLYSNLREKNEREAFYRKTTPETKISGKQQIQIRVKLPQSNNTIETEKTESKAITINNSSFIEPKSENQHLMNTTRVAAEHSLNVARESPPNATSKPAHTFSTKSLRRTFIELPQNNTTEPSKNISTKLTKKFQIQSFQNFSTESPRNIFTKTSKNISIEPPQNISTQIQLNTSTELPQNISTQVQLNISTELPQNISTQVQLNISTELPQNICTQIQLNTSTELPQNISTVMQQNVSKESFQNCSLQLNKNDTTETVGNLSTTTPQDCCTQTLENCCVESTCETSAEQVSSYSQKNISNTLTERINSTTAYHINTEELEKQENVDDVIETQINTPKPLDTYRKKKKKGRKKGSKFEKDSEEYIADYKEYDTPKIPISNKDNDKRHKKW